MSEYGIRPGETPEERMNRLPGNMIQYSVNLSLMADGKRSCYKELISLCKLFDIEYDAGDFYTPYRLLPRHETDLKSLEAFMSGMKIPVTKNLRTR